MKKRSLLGLAAIGGAAILLRRVRLREDLEWHDVVKPGSVATIDGYPVHYVDQGAGPAILLIHGFGGQTFSFRKIIPALTADHRVIAVDLKGYGYSARDATQDLSHTAQVRMLDALLQRLGIDRTVVVGHSMGGAVAMRFATTHPEKTAALVLLASASGEERHGRRMPPLPPALLRPLLPYLAGIAATRLLEASFYDHANLTDEVREEYLRPAHIKGSMDGLLKMMRDAANDAPFDHARITMPVLLLNGAHDRVVPLSTAIAVRERIPHARLVVIERAAHLPMEDQPDETVRAIRDFLAEAVGSTRAAAPSS